MSVLAAYRGLLSNGAISRLLIGEWVSSIGDWLYLVALLVVVYRETSDPVVLGIVGAARVIPYVILSVPAGIVADRFDRRLVLLVTDIARGAIMLGLAWLVATDAPVVWIVALAILATCFSTFFEPTIGAYIPALVRDERELGPANSAWSTLDSLAYVIGPAIAGVLIAFSDLVPAFLINAASFAFIAVVLWGLPSSRGTSPGLAAAAEPPESSGPEAEAAPASPAGGRLAAPVTAGPPVGLRSLARPLVGLGALDVVTAFSYGGLGVLTVIIATDQLGIGDQATGYLNAAIGVGGMIGAIASGVLVLRPNLTPILLIGAVGMGGGLAVLGLSTTLAVALVAMAVFSAGNLLGEVVARTAFQRIVPDAIRGRALGSMATVATLAFATGSLAVPVLASSAGTEVVLGVCAVAIVTAGVLTTVLAAGGMRREPDAASELLIRVRTSPIFAGVPPTALELAASRASFVDVVAGTVVIRQGEPADRFYLIAHGRFAVDQTAPDGAVHRLRTMTADEVFGELGLLRRAPRSATVTALEDGRLLALDGADFLALVSAGPGLAARLIDMRPGVAAPLGTDDGTTVGLSAG